jgi:Cu/Zn superoxide dismutase
MQAANRRLVQAEARALAASSKFRDPSDAVAFLGDLSKVPVDTDGRVDTKALTSRLNDLAKQKPYLLIEEKPTRPTGDAGQGPRQTAGPSNMNALIHGLAQRGT